MKRIEINEAEAIIEPFYDGGTSDPDDHTPRYRVLDAYRIKATDGARVRVEQGWAFAVIQIEQTCADVPILQMERDCDLSLQGYDTFLVFGSIPTAISFSLTAEIDGETVTLCQPIRGTGASDEYEIPIRGSRMTGLRLTCWAQQAGGRAELNWFGLSHRARLADMLARKPQYDAAWEGCFVQTPPHDPVPKLGLLFDGADLHGLREKLAKSPFREIYQQKKEAAYRDLTICPEDYIGRFVPQYDRRWNRSRDRAWALDPTKNACGMHTVIENLAFVGMIEGDLTLLRMACRHAISIAHCEYWCESPMGVLAGATWHHRSFTENHYCTVLALVLDWCGSLLTPFAVQLLCDAIAMKGLPRIESDFRRCEYIRHMNQGIVFSQGRIFAQLALLAHHPRYAADLQQSEQDLIEMVSNYVQPDGGVLEGPGYWRFTFHESLPAFYALARYHGQPFTCYRDVFSKTGAFALAMLSMEGDGTVLHAVNDCHPNTTLSCTLANSFYQFTGDPAWKALYERLMAQQKVDEDTFALISAPLPDGVRTELPAPDCLFPITGQVGIRRQGRDTETRFHLCSGPTCPTHFHADKGSLLIEAAGQILCPDCGNANYFESELSCLFETQAHSLLCPLSASGTRAAQGRYAAGGRILFARQEIGTAPDAEKMLDVMSDDTAAWSDGVYRTVQRRVFSPIAELAVVTDTFALGTADAVVFQLNCFGEWHIAPDSASARLGGVTLCVRPLNWCWDTACVHAMQDGAHRPVWQLRAVFRAAREASLMTAITIEHHLPMQLCPAPDGWCVTQGEKKFQLRVQGQELDWQTPQ